MNQGDQVKFIVSIMDAILAFIGFIILIYVDNNAMAGILFILPCIKETIEALSLEKRDLPKSMLITNWIALIMSIIAIVLFVLSAIGQPHVYCVVATFITLIFPIKYGIYVSYYWEKI